MTIQEMAKKVVENFNMKPVAEKYNLSYRAFDRMVEVIAYFDNPNYITEAKRENVQPPKGWFTVGVITASLEVPKSWL